MSGAMLILPFFFIALLALLNATCRAFTTASIALFPGKSADRFRLVFAPFSCLDRCALQTREVGTFSDRMGDQ